MKHYSYALATVLTLVLVAGCSQPSAPTNQQGVPANPNPDAGYETVMLNLSNTGLTKLPDSVLKQVQLEELDISHNRLTGALPAEIRRLSNLRFLDASNNQMTGLPAELGQLQKLEVLDLSNNQLTGLPLELGNLKNLQRLVLTGNSPAAADLEKIRQALPNTQIIE